VYLSDTIVIMTSNLGSEHFRKLTNPLGFAAGVIPTGQIRTDIDRELEGKFSPEFRNRIDSIVVFEPLSKGEVREIALKYLGQVEATLARHGKTLTVDPRALDKIADQGYSPAYGARFLKRVIDDAVKLPISQRWKDVVRFRATVQEDAVVIKPTDCWLTASADQDAIAV
jgi:ATP-dependent Clp protease ATP-binding subunit ClpA